MAKPTRVAIDDWQLHGMHSIDAAVEVNIEKQNAPQHAPSGASKLGSASGSDSRAPIVAG